LKGEVGVYRRQLEDNQQVLREKNSVVTGGVSSGQIQELRTRGQAVCERLKPMHDRLREQGGDPNALLQRILTNGIHDGPLEGFLNVRQNTARSLEDPQLNPDFVDVFNGIITDMDSKIKQRLDGYLLGLQAQASSIQDQLEELQRNSGNGRLRLVSDLEHAVRDAEERVGRSE
jgi:hypothetical protein